MASMILVKGGKYRVSWYDAAGVRQRRVLPKSEAKELFEQLSAQRLFEKSGLTPALGVQARNFKKILFREIAEGYMNEHLLVHTRAESNAYYVKILIEKWGDLRLPLLQVTAFRDWIRHALDNPVKTPKRGGWAQTQLAAGSVDKLVRYMTAIFSWARERQIISEGRIPIL